MMTECETINCKNIIKSQPNDYEIHSWKMINDKEYRKSRIGQTIQWMYDHGYDKSEKINYVWGTCQRLLQEKIIK